ncbi:MAG: hypothetical protein K6E35_08720 [Bacteroidales bacterium]|nr:hypothetical protein [Bacteroidales bacterium]
MLKNIRIALAALLLCLLFSPPAKGQQALVGLYQSPKGVGVSAMFEGERGDVLDIVTLRTDFYGILTGRTDEPGVCLTYTHDYSFLWVEWPEFTMSLHAGAGGLLGYVHDWEEGIFSAIERQLQHSAGFAAGLAGNVGLRLDFDRRLSLDLSFTTAPGIHLRTDKETGAVILSFYKNGLYRSYFPQINILYRF